MAKEIDMTNFIAIGNGEPCPFCATEGDRPVKDIFINDKDNDIMEHMMDEHPSELNKALFTDPPPKPWLEQEFLLVIAKIASRLKHLEENNKVTEEEYQESLHNMFSVMEDFFKDITDES